MISLKNKVQLIGNLGSNPEILTLKSGKKVAKFSIAVNDAYKNADGEKVTNTNWFNIVAWDNLATLVVQILEKGSKVAVNGKLLSKTYETKSGEKRYLTEIVLTEFLSLESNDKSKTN